MSNYEVYLNNDRELVVVDKREPIDLSLYDSVIANSWKTIITPSRRKSRSNTAYPVNANGLRIFTYPDNSIVVANPRSGDFIPPGYSHVSEDIHFTLENGYYYNAILKRCKLKPLRGLVVCSELKSVPNTFGEGPSRSPSRVIGWDSMHNNSNVNMLRVRNDEEGYRCDREECSVVLCQTLDKSLTDGLTRIQVKAANAKGVVLGNTTLTQVEGTTDTWLWEGEPLNGSVDIFVGIGGDPVRSIEVTA